MWGYLIGFLAVVLLIVAGLVYESIAEKNDARRFLPPGKLVAVDGHNLHIHVVGQRRPSQPLVVLIAGMGDWSLRWGVVQPLVAEFARVCSYDRVGYGWSDDDSKPCTLENMADELHVLLTEANEPAPYLFVGHSLGAMIARVYNTRYPGEVIGMVLPDPAHEGFFEQAAAIKGQLSYLLRMYSLAIPLAHIGLIRLLSRTPLFPKMLRGYGPEVRSAYYAGILTPRFFHNLLDELRGIFLNVDEAMRTLRSAGSLGDMPLVVIKPLYPDEDAPQKITARDRENIGLLHAGLDKLAALSSRGRVVAAERSWHNVPGDQPEVVVEAIQLMITDNEQLE